MLPNVIWQARHHFISLEFLSYLHARDSRQGRYDGFYREQLLVCVNLVTAPLVLRGLWFCFFATPSRKDGAQMEPRRRPYLLLGWTFAIGFLIFALRGSRAYYTAPLYPMLIASGSVQWGNLVKGMRPVWSRLAYSAQWTGIALGGAAFALLVMPLAPIGSGIWRITSRVSDQYREEIGWPDLAQAVAGVYRSLPAREQGRTGILTGNYGEAGALNLYGPPLGLPQAMGLTNSFWYRGYDSRLPETVIVAGFKLEEGRRLFASCVVAAKNENRLAIENEESRDHPDILLCRNLRVPWSVYWESHRRFG
jgi:hypothetical protein